jgi:hypothetical protein
MSHPTKPTDHASNRTGIATAPKKAVKRMIEGAREAMPNPSMAPPGFLEIHEQMCETAPPVGTMPPAPDKGEPTALLLDKLGERLAFERSGVRLYQALMAKLEAADPKHTAITKADLEEIREDELRHFGLVKAAIEELGGDPTAVTPCADVIGVASMGFVQVLADPRTTLTQCLDTMLVVELADNDGWELLIQLTEALGHAEIAERFRVALAEETDHLMRVRTWLQRAVGGQAGVPQDAAGMIV